MTWFNKQSRLVQVLLLLIPVVNWITEIVVRWSTFFKKGGIIRLIVCIVVTFLGHRRLDRPYLGSDYQASVFPIKPIKEGQIPARGLFFL